MSYLYFSLNTIKRLLKNIFRINKNNFMQIRFKLILAVSVTAILFLSSCGSKTNKEGRYIPANAAFVLHMNGKSLNAKQPWEEIRQSELFKQAYADSAVPVILKSAMDNPENTGIDVKAKWKVITAS